MAEVKFAIISSQRSGSTLIRTSLDSHPDVTCAGEVFFPVYDQEYSFRKYLEVNDISQLRALFLRRSTVFSFLDYLFSAPEKLAIGFKLMYAQTRYLPYRYPMAMDYLRAKNVRIIHVTRVNSLRTLISREIAKATGVYHLRTERIINRKVRIDTATLLNSLGSIEREKEKWRDRLRHVNSIEISYEDFIKDRSHTSERMLDFLGVDSGVELSSPLKKVSNKPIQEVIENYPEVEAIIKNSRFSELLCL